MQRGIRGCGIVVVATVLAQVALTGCKVTPRNVEVEQSPPLQTQWIRVALVGLGENEATYWDNIGPGEIWRPGNNLREHAKNMGYLRMWNLKAGTDPIHFALGKTDPIWKVWRDRNATHVVVIVDIRTGSRLQVLSLARHSLRKRDIRLSLRYRPAGSYGPGFYSPWVSINHSPYVEVGGS